MQWSSSDGPPVGVSQMAVGYCRAGSLTFVAILYCWHRRDDHHYRSWISDEGKAQ